MAAEAVQYRWHDERVQRMFRNLSRSLEGPSRGRTMTAIGAYWQRQIIKTFEAQGARSGLSKWPARSPNTEKTPVGTWRLSYGLDKYPTLTAEQFANARSEAMSIGLWRWGQTGYFPGYEYQRRYNKRPKLLQVSGTLRALFGARPRIKKSSVVAGMRTNTITAGRGKQVKGSEIIKRRPVITVTPKDKKQMVKTVLTAIQVGIRSA